MAAAEAARDLNLTNGEIKTEITLRPLMGLRRLNRCGPGEDFTGQIAGVGQDRAAHGKVITANFCICKTSR